MNNKASAHCRNGHSFEFGACGAPIKKLFGGTKGCGCRRFEQHTSRQCPTCGDMVPMTAFRKTGLCAKLSYGISRRRPTLSPSATATAPRVSSLRGRLQPFEPTPLIVG